MLGLRVVAQSRGYWFGQRIISENCNAEGLLKRIRIKRLPMTKIHTKLVCSAIVAALFCASSQFASAGTILKLSLGDVDPDLEYSGGVGGVLSTIDDGAIPLTTGEQNTAVDFTDFLSGMTDITLPEASYTLNGVTAVGPATVIFGTIVAQNFAGGEFQLYDDSNVLLLDVDLSSTVLTGPLGTSPTGSVFSVTNGTVVGGSLDPLIIDDSISFSIAMTDINGGAGLSVSPAGTLNPFVADASKLIAADPVPEPSAALLIMVGSMAVPAVMRRRAW